MQGTTEIILIMLAVVLLFSGKKIPEFACGLGSAVSEFKNGFGGKIMTSAAAK